MIIDSHCHAWPRWPYQPSVPDDESRGRVEQLLHEMDLHGVDQAVVICARIDRNADNNDYIAEQARRYADRLHQFPDVDCSWTETYHQPGAADRLREVADRWPIRGFTHYLMTYRQSLEAFRTHCPFIPEADKARILGDTLDRLLKAAGHQATTG